jgi:hypothetical protein
MRRIGEHLGSRAPPQTELGGLRVLNCKTSYLAKVDSDDCTDRAELTGQDDIGKTLGLEEPVGQIGAPARFSLISPNGN